MTPIELKKLRSTKKDPQSYLAYMPPFRAEGNDVLDRNGYFVSQFSYGEIFMVNGKAYNIAEVIAEGVNRLCARLSICASDNYETTQGEHK